MVQSNQQILDSLHNLTGTPDLIRASAYILRYHAFLRQLCPSLGRSQVFREGIHHFSSRSRLARSSSNGAKRLASSAMITHRHLHSANVRKFYAPQGRRYASQLYIPSRRLHTAQRSFTFSSPRRREQASSTPKQTFQDGLPSKADQPENITPETIRRPRGQAGEDNLKADSFLSEQTVSNKEQRKADWAIMKEMSRYLWPKVGLAVS